MKTAAAKEIAIIANSAGLNKLNFSFQIYSIQLYKQQK